jgi:hypothetical protein
VNGKGRVNGSGGDGGGKAVSAARRSARGGFRLRQVSYACNRIDKTTRKPKDFVAIRLIRLRNTSRLGVYRRVTATSRVVALRDKREKRGE